MTGEMSQSEVTREAYPAHFAIADVFGGEVRAFDQYQGPYIVIPDVPGRLWLQSEDGGYGNVYNDSTEQLSNPFWLHWKDVGFLERRAVAAAREVLPLSIQVEMG